MLIQLGCLTEDVLCLRSSDAVHAATCVEENIH